MTEVAAKKKYHTLKVDGLKGKKVKLILTELRGCKPLDNGDVVRVEANLATKLVEAYRPHLVMLPADKGKDGELAEATLAKGDWEPAAAPAPKSEKKEKAEDEEKDVDTSKADEKSSEGSAGNKSMAGKPTKKA